MGAFDITGIVNGDSYLTSCVKLLKGAVNAAGEGVAIISFVGGEPLWAVCECGVNVSFFKTKLVD